MTFPKPRTLYLDLESFNETPISYGTYRYAQSAETIILAYALNDGPVQVVDFTIPADKRKFTANLKDTIAVPDTTVVIHNSMFDRNVLRYDLGVDIPTSMIHDTMVIAMMHALPAGLDALCQVFGLPPEFAKDKDGKRLIKKFCIPQPKTGKRIMPEDEPEEWRKFMDYAGSDIRAMRELYKKLPKWNFKLEHPTWIIDQRINDRGFKVDVKLATKAIAAVEKAQAALAVRSNQLSDGYVASATQADALLKHLLMEHGVYLPNMQKDTLERRLNDPELTYAVKELLAVRLDASTTSTSKYQALIEAVNADARMRGALQAYGAGRTGRWAGRKFQPQNLPRPQHKWDEILFAIDCLMDDCLHMFTDDVMKLTSSVIRSTIIADEGRKLAVADLSNIEGRVAAWLAGEAWKVKAFTLYDTYVLDENGNRIWNKRFKDWEREGYDLYALAYAKSFGVHPSVVMDNKVDGDGSMRQIGKVQELALGYGGGVGAFVTMAANNKMDLKAMAAKALPSIPAEVVNKANNFWEKTDRRYDLDQDVFVACDSLKRLWREAHQEIATYWFELEDVVRQAVANPKFEYTARKLRIIRRKNWLLVYLPSGRVICYPDIQVDGEGTISYMGIDTYSKQWGRQKTYGGKLFENVCQAVARDVLAHNMPLVEDAGYPIILTVHDELITEPEDDDCFTGKELAELMSTNPPWAKGLPLAAGGFSCDRYRKE